MSRADTIAAKAVLHEKISAKSSQSIYVGDPVRWSALAFVLSAAFLGPLDFSIVNVAIPSIQNDLGATDSQTQMVIASYALAYAVLLVTGGRLGDIAGRKRMFMIGMAGFTLASAFCGLAQSPLALILLRILQGAMGAMMMPQVLSTIQVSFPARRAPHCLRALRHGRWHRGLLRQRNRRRAH